MSEIKKGDLVYVVKETPCCANFASVGKMFIVEAVYVREHARCSWCLQERAAICVSDGHGCGYDAYRLKVINPPAISTPTEIKQAVEA